MSFYKQQIPTMIDKYKTAMKQCLDIVDKKIEVEELSDDKLFNVLRGKRQAGEDAKHYAKEVDILQNELDGKEDAPVAHTNPAKQRAKS